jgi:hypothetical protein
MLCQSHVIKKMKIIYLPIILRIHESIKLSINNRYDLL